jgi:DNA-binding CsgD family transcriptional regulator
LISTNDIDALISAAKGRDVAPLLADAYGLSERECEVSRLIARGLPTDAIARELYLSPWTVQDHLKAIFGKVGVNGRGELVARPYLADGPADLTG